MAGIMAPSQWYAGKDLITSSPSRREALAYSCGVNIPTMADFNLPTLCHSTQCWEEMHTISSY